MSYSKCPLANYFAYCSVYVSNLLFCMSSLEKCLSLLPIFWLGCLFSWCWAVWAIYCCSVSNSCLTLQPHGLQHARLPCPSLSPGVYSDSCPLKSVMPSNHHILCHPLLLLPSIFPSLRVFPNKSALHIRWPEYWSFSFSISSSNAFSGLISFRIDCFDFLAVQGTRESLLQHHNSKTSISSLVLSLLYGPTLTSVCDNGKNHSFDYTDLCKHSNAFVF